MSNREKINSIKSLKEANELGRTLFDDVATDITATWRGICEQAHNQCSVLLSSLIKDINELILPKEEPKLDHYVAPSLEIENNLLNRLNVAEQGFFGGSVVATLLISHIFVFLAPPWLFSVWE